MDMFFVVIFMVLSGGMGSAVTILITEWERKDADAARKEFKQEEERRRRDPVYILRKRYRAELKLKKERLSSAGQVIKICLDNDSELNLDMKRVRLLKDLNEADYLVYVEDAIRETFDYTRTNLKHVANYLIVDGCIDNLEKELSKEHADKVNTIIERNGVILERIGALLDESARMVNGYSKSDDSEIIASLNASIKVIHDLTTEKLLI